MLLFAIGHFLSRSHHIPEFQGHLEVAAADHFVGFEKMVFTFAPGIPHTPGPYTHAMVGPFTFLHPPDREFPKSLPPGTWRRGFAGTVLILFPAPAI